MDAPPPPPPLCHPSNPEHEVLSRCPLTFFQHAHFEAFHEAAGLAGFASALGDLTFIRGRAAVLYVTYSTEFERKRLSDWWVRRDGGSPKKSYPQPQSHVTPKTCHQTSEKCQEAGYAAVATEETSKEAA